MEGKWMENTKRIVPWLSMDEWSRVYSQVYSNKLDDKRTGLNQMAMWKSRVAKLPLGVECSLYLLQAMLRDEEYKKPLSSLSESDITLMYSSAIIRFINLISHLGQMERHQPISAIAKMAGIPEWLVGIRHEATHAKMPSLSILRPGAQLAMEWLKENYWRVEEEDSSSLYWPESKEATSRMLRANVKTAVNDLDKDLNGQYQVIPEELQVMVSMLIALSKEMVSHRVLNDVDSRLFFRFALELWRQTHEDLQLSRRRVAKLQLKLRDVQHVLMSEIERILSDWVEFEGVEPGPKEEEAVKILKGRCFVSAVCQCPRLLDLPKKGTLFSSLRPIWKRIQKWQAMPYLMEMLTRKEIENETDLTPHLHLITELAESVLQARNNPDDPGNLFKFDESLKRIKWDAIAGCILRDPRAESWNAASKMFKLCENPPNAETQLQLISLLKIVTNQSPNPAVTGNILAPIYTVDMLATSEEEIVSQNTVAQQKLNQEEEVSYSSPAPVVTEWTLCTDHDWSSIPIGSLPDLNDCSKSLQLNEVEWQVVEAECHITATDLFVPGTKRTGERFDWNSLQRKRRRRGGLTKDGPVGDMIPVPQPEIN